MTEWGSTPTVVAPRGAGQLRQGMKNGEEYVIYGVWIRSLLSALLCALCLFTSADEIGADAQLEEQTFNFRHAGRIR